MTSDTQAMSSDQSICLEMAEKEFDRFADSMDLEIDPATLDDDDKKDLKKIKSRLVTAMMNGKLEINDDGEAVVLTKDGKRITFHERTGASIMAMDKAGDGQNGRKMYASMSQMTGGTGIPVFANMGGSDIKLCESVWILLMT